MPPPSVSLRDPPPSRGRLWTAQSTAQPADQGTCPCTTRISAFSNAAGRGTRPLQKTENQYPHRNPQPNSAAALNAPTNPDAQSTTQQADQGMCHHTTRISAFSNAAGRETRPLPNQNPTESSPPTSVAALNAPTNLDAQSTAQRANQGTCHRTTRISAFTLRATENLWGF